jgi:hypothetical protein
MPGVLLASTDGAGWTVETVDLWLTGRRAATPGRADPLGDGPQLLVRRYCHVIGFYRSVADLPAVGVDMALMAVAARWLPAGRQRPPGGDVELVERLPEIPDRAYVLLTDSRDDLLRAPRVRGDE